MTPRVSLEGACNFRDLGGLTTEQGRRVRFGHIYRSNGLSRLSDRDREVLDRLGVTAIFDLRSRAEREAARTAWRGEGAETFVFRARHKRRLADMAADHAATREGALALMRSFYWEMPMTMGGIFAEIIMRIGAGAVPCIIHCSAGKDRTGVAVAILLTALGVPQKAVVEDYARSARVDGLRDDMVRSVIVNGASEAMMRQYPPEAVAVLMDAAPEYIDRALDAVGEIFGGIEAYLAAHDVSARALEAFRAACLMPDDATHPQCGPGDRATINERDDR